MKWRILKFENICLTHSFRLESWRLNEIFFRHNMKTLWYRRILRCTRHSEENKEMKVLLGGRQRDLEGMGRHDFGHLRKVRLFWVIHGMGIWRCGRRIESLRKGRFFWCMVLESLKFRGFSLVNSFWEFQI